jgi:beta-lactam-binding protein with PASTA domain
MRSFLMKKMSWVLALGMLAVCVALTGCPPDSMSVPEVVGLTQASASTAITDAGLTVGAVTQEYSATIPTGQVISQAPVAGESVALEDAVSLVISRGPQPVTVPNVAGMTQAAAATAVTTVGLSVGAITQEYSPTVASGIVMGQSPASGTSVSPGSAMALTVSKGPQPVTVPNVVGMTQAAASTTVAGAGLATGAITEEFSATVASGVVLSQSPASGASVLPGAAVALTLSKGPQPVTVLDVVGQTQPAASTVLSSMGLTVGTVTQEFSATVAFGAVISQSPAAGVSVLPGVAVALVVSKGPQPVAVPDVVGQIQADASTAIIGAGLTVGTVTQVYSATVASGAVMSQSPSAGVSVLPGYAVAMTLSKGPQPVTVPNVVGQTQATASTILTGAGLAVGAITQEYSSTVASGAVISQSPVSGAAVLPGVAVALTVSRGVQLVTVPKVVGQTQASASTVITGAGLTVGTITQVYSSTIAPGLVISQSPAPGTSLVLGAAMALTVSKGQQPVAVPNVAGMIQSAASMAITGATLTVGAVTQEYSSTFDTGWVISQSPASGTLLLPGAAVALVVSKGPRPVAVPNVAGMTQAAASTAITGATLAVGEVTQEYSSTVAAGSVISQSPVAGTSVLPGTAVALTVSMGPQPVEVPNVAGMTQTDASTALTSLGLTVGAIAQEYSSTVASGSVVSQAPAAGTTVDIGSAVALTVSMGLQPVTVPNVVGMTQPAASAAFTSVGLSVGIVTHEYSSTVASGSVISQAPAAGTTVSIGVAVELTVSKGPRPVTVPSVAGQTQAAAETALTAANLTTGTITQQFSNTVAVGVVISQYPSAGASALPGSAVNLAVSKGPDRRTVPNLAGLGQSAAQTAITEVGLTVGTVTQVFSASVPVGDIVGQDPAAGTGVAPGTPVNIIVSKGPATVPDVVGQTQTAAGTLIAGASLVVGTVTQEYSATVAFGSVISQTPPSGTQVGPGTAVALTVSKGVKPVPVPDVVGQTQADASAAMAGGGLTVLAVTQEYSPTVASGVVISQSPAAGTMVAPGSAVALTVSKGPQPVPVPFVLGMTEAEASMAVVDAGLTVGTVTQQFSSAYDTGDIMTQSPAAGTSVLPGSAVALTVSKGPQPGAVPNVVGRTQAAAETLITGARFVVGTVTLEYSATVPAGTVISQTPVAGTILLPGVAVDLVVSRGGIVVPDVFSQTQADASSAITGAGLTVGAITLAYSVTVPDGSVVSQTPLAGTVVLPGDAVDLAISRGGIAVPDVVGQTQDDAAAAVLGAQLALGAVTQEYSMTVPAGTVISQTPVAGTAVLPGSLVGLVVSKGGVVVPDVVGQTQTIAAAAITGLGLVVGTVTQEYSLTVASGVVISQLPLSGTELSPGSAVALTVSKGPQPVTVPSVIGKTQAAASTLITNAALTVGAITLQVSETVPAGSVISQSPAPGTIVGMGSAVTLTVSSGPPPVPVPDVVGQTQTDAGALIAAGSLVVGTVTEEYSATIPLGVVISQSPAPGTMVSPGTAVEMTVSAGPEPVNVPNVVGETETAAGTLIVGADLVVGTITQAFSSTIALGSVVSQLPAAGTMVLPGTVVALVVSLGPPPPVTVPDVVGMMQTDAETAITGAGVAVGTVTAEYNETVPLGQVMSQNPAGGESVPPETPVDLVVSAGREPVLLPGNVALDMLRMPGGTFDMGSPGTEPQRNADESPQHSVTLGAFWMSKYEVTKRQWTAVMGTTPWAGHSSVLADLDSPAVYVSWFDAQAFMVAANNHTGRTFLLPSESQWEYAGRAGTTSRFYWGDDLDASAIGDYAWYSGNSAGAAYAHVVGQKLPNAWGLYDMSGNVFEWCLDWYHTTYTGAPADGSAWDVGNNNRVARGGAWSFGDYASRSAFRGYYGPSSPSSDTGFRLTMPVLGLAKSALPTTYSSVGDIITYSFTVTNNDNVALYAPFAVTDDKAGAVDCTSAPATLEPLDSFTVTGTYTIVLADITTTIVVGGATASAQDESAAPVVSNRAVVTVSAVPVLGLAKSAFPTTFSAVDDVITYSYVVTNNSQAAVYAPFAVTDDKIDAVDCSSAPATLAPGESFTVTATYAIVQQDVDSGGVVNNAGATGQDSAAATVVSNNTYAVVLAAAPTP